RFDPWAEYRALDAAGRVRFVEAAGRDSAGWRARSPLAQSAKIAVPVLVVHTEEAGSPAAAIAFASARAERRLSTEARINGQEARPVRELDARRVALDFLGRRTRASGP